MKKNRQSSLFEEQKKEPSSNQVTEENLQKNAPPKRNYLKIFFIIFGVYVVLGEFFLPDPIRFSTIFVERSKNIVNKMTIGTADSKAVAACKENRSIMAQQAYIECNKDVNKTGPTCEFLRDDVLTSNCGIY